MSTNVFPPLAPNVTQTTVDPSAKVGGQKNFMDTIVLSFPYPAIERIIKAR